MKSIRDRFIQFYHVRYIDIIYSDSGIQYIIYIYMGEGWLVFPDLSSAKKNLMELIFNLCGEFWWSLEGPVSEILYPHLHVGAPVISSGLSRCVQILKREWGAESNGKLPLIKLQRGGRTAFGQNFSLGVWVCSEDLPLDRTLWWWLYNIYLDLNHFTSKTELKYQVCIKNTMLKVILFNENWPYFQNKLIVFAIT